MGVLAMLELQGDTAALMAASDELDRLLPTPDGLLARMVAPTDDGMVVFQLWESAAARQRHADNPAHTEALAASGLLAAVRGRRSRVFEDTSLRRFGETESH